MSERRAWTMLATAAVIWLALGIIGLAHSWALIAAAAWAAIVIVWVGAKDR